MLQTAVVRTQSALHIEADYQPRQDPDSPQEKSECALCPRENVHFLFSQTALELVFLPFCVLLAPEMTFEGEDLQFSVALKKLLLREHVYFHHFNFEIAISTCMWGPRQLIITAFLLIRKLL